MFVNEFLKELFLLHRISIIFRVKSAKAVKITDMDLIKRLAVIVGIFVLCLLIRTLVSPPVVIVGKYILKNTIVQWCINFKWFRWDFWFHRSQQWCLKSYFIIVSLFRSFKQPVNFDYFHFKDEKYLLKNVIKIQFVLFLRTYFENSMIFYILFFF